MAFGAGGRLLFCKASLRWLAVAFAECLLTTVAMFQPDGDQMSDVRARCAMAKTRADKLRHVWAADLPLDLKLRL